MYTSLTATQKLYALSIKYYQGSVWVPKKGDYYTSTRNDLELYRVVGVTDKEVFTCYTTNPDVLTTWLKKDFLALHNFGRHRVHVPLFILENTQ